MYPTDTIASCAALVLAVHAGNLERGLVSCTGSQFCGFALIETKQRAMDIVAKLEASLHLPNPVRIHWTGCPNSCGQAQVADIGLMGGPAKLDGKAVEGVKIFLGGKIGENPELANEIEAGVPCHEDHLLPKLRGLLIEHFGATPLEAAV
jgi:ferredoxin-nitrite reductase